MKEVSQFTKFGNTNSYRYLTSQILSASRCGNYYGADLLSNSNQPTFTKYEQQQQRLALQKQQEEQDLLCPQTYSAFIHSITNNTLSGAAGPNDPIRLNQRAALQQLGRNSQNCRTDCYEYLPESLWAATKKSSIYVPDTATSWYESNRNQQTRDPALIESEPFLNERDANLHLVRPIREAEQQPFKSITAKRISPEFLGILQQYDKAMLARNPMYGLKSQYFKRNRCRRGNLPPSLAPLPVCTPSVASSYPKKTKDKRKGGLLKTFSRMCCQSKCTESSKSKESSSKKDNYYSDDEEEVYRPAGGQDQIDTQKKNFDRRSESIYKVKRQNKPSKLSNTAFGEKLNAYIRKLTGQKSNPTIVEQPRNPNGECCKVKQSAGGVKQPPINSSRNSNSVDPDKLEASNKKEEIAAIETQTITNEDTRQSILAGSTNFKRTSEAIELQRQSIFNVKEKQRESCVECLDENVEKVLRQELCRRRASSASTRQRQKQKKPELPEPSKSRTFSCRRKLLRKEKKPSKPDAKSRSTSKVRAKSKEKKEGKEIKVTTGKSLFCIWCKKDKTRMNDSVVFDQLECMRHSASTEPRVIRHPKSELSCQEYKNLHKIDEELRKVEYIRTEPRVRIPCKLSVQKSETTKKVRKCKRFLETEPRVSRRKIDLKSTVGSKNNEPCTADMCRKYKKFAELIPRVHGSNRRLYPTYEVRHCIKMFYPQVAPRSIAYREYDREKVISQRIEHAEKKRRKKELEAQKLQSEIKKKMQMEELKAAEKLNRKKEKEERERRKIERKQLKCIKKRERQLEIAIEKQWKCELKKQFPCEPEKQSKSNYLSEFLKKLRQRNVCKSLGRRDVLDSSSSCSCSCSRSDVAINDDCPTGRPTENEIVLPKSDCCCNKKVPRRKKSKECKRVLRGVPHRHRSCHGESDLACKSEMLQRVGECHKQYNEWLLKNRAKRRLSMTLAKATASATSTKSKTTAKKSSSSKTRVKRKGVSKPTTPVASTTIFDMFAKKAVKPVEKPPQPDYLKMFLTCLKNSKSRRKQLLNRSPSNKILKQADSNDLLTTMQFFKAPPHERIPSCPQAVPVACLETPKTTEKPSKPEIDASKEPSVSSLEDMLVRIAQEIQYRRGKSATPRCSNINIDAVLSAKQVVKEKEKTPLFKKMEIAPKWHKPLLSASSHSHRVKRRRSSDHCIPQFPRPRPPPIPKRCEMRKISRILTAPTAISNQTRTPEYTLGLTFRSRSQHESTRRCKKINEGLFKS